MRSFLQSVCQMLNSQFVAVAIPRCVLSSRPSFQIELLALALIGLAWLGNPSELNAAPITQMATASIGSISSTTERTAKLVQPKAGQKVATSGEVFTFIARNKDTAGAYALMEVLIAPNQGPPLHTHPQFEESFEVLEGDLTFQADGEKIPAPAGSYINIPRGSVHTFVNTGKIPARIRTLVVPAGFDDYIEEAGTAVEDLTLPTKTDFNAIRREIELGAKYGITFADTQQIEAILQQPKAAES